MGVDTAIQYQRYALNSGWNPIDAKVINEANVALTVNGEGWLTFLCTPADLETLAAGFLFNEGILQSADEIALIRPCDNLSNIDVWLHHAVEKPVSWKRTSGCTGGVTNASPTRPIPAVDVGETIAPDSLLACMEQLIASQEIYRETGGIHCSALSDGSRVVLQAEDIGRHNTLDKLAGKLLLQPIVLPHRIILSTGRISSEMLQKSARLGAEVILSRTSPTSESIRLANELGITLIGYARRAQMNIYTHPERLKKM